jgi:hypothetical protein
MCKNIPGVLDKQDSCCLLRPRLRFPLPVAYLVAGACSVPYGRRPVRPPTCRASETGHRLSAKPAYLQGEARASQVTGPSSSCVPWSNTPPDTTPSSPKNTQGIVVAFESSRTLGIREAAVSGPQSHGPHVRVPTHRRWHFGHRRKAGYQPGGLTLSRAGFAPAG